jgi:hypothetical protein
MARLRRRAQWRLIRGSPRRAKIAADRRGVSNYLSSITNGGAR